MEFKRSHLAYPSLVDVPKDMAQILLGLVRRGGVPHLLWHARRDIAECIAGAFNGCVIEFNRNRAVIYGPVGEMLALSGQIGEPASWLPNEAAASAPGLQVKLLACRSGGLAKRILAAHEAAMRVVDAEMRSQGDTPKQWGRIYDNPFPLLGVMRANVWSKLSDSLRERGIEFQHQVTTDAGCEYYTVHVERGGLDESTSILDAIRAEVRNAPRDYAPAVHLRRAPVPSTKRSKSKSGRGTTPSQRARLLAMYPWCLCCGATENLTVDHVRPVALGGSNSIENKQILCFHCNNDKGMKEIDYRSMPVPKVRGLSAQEQEDQLWREAQQRRDMIDQFNKQGYL